MGQNQSTANHLVRVFRVHTQAYGNVHAFVELGVSSSFNGRYRFVQVMTLLPIELGERRLLFLGYSCHFRLSTPG
jgi:hypothetical protein